MKRIFPPALLVAGLVACSPAPSSGPTAEEQRNTEIILEVFEALGSDDLATLERYFEPETEFIIGLESRPRGGPYTTFPEAAPFPGALDNVTVEVETILAEDDEVAIQSLICGDHAAPLLGFEPTGKRVCGRYLNLYTLNDGRIVSNAVGVHRDQLREQLEANAQD